MSFSLLHFAVFRGGFEYCTGPSEIPEGSPHRTQAPLRTSSRRGLTFRINQRKIPDFQNDATTTHFACLLRTTPSIHFPQYCIKKHQHKIPSKHCNYYTFCGVCIVRLDSETHLIFYLDIFCNKAFEIARLESGVHFREHRRKFTW